MVSFSWDTSCDQNTENDIKTKRGRQPLHIVPHLQYVQKTWTSPVIKVNSHLKTVWGSCPAKFIAYSRAAQDMWLTRVHSWSNIWSTFSFRIKRVYVHWGTSAVRGKMIRGITTRRTLLLIQIYDNHCDIIMKMTPYPFLNSSNVIVPHLSLSGCLLDRSSHQSLSYSLKYQSHNICIQYHLLQQWEVDFANVIEATKANTLKQSVICSSC